MTTQLSPFRKGIFTSSQVWRLMGKSLDTETAQSYIFEKVCEQLALPLPQYTNAAMEWGLEHEALAREVVSRRLGVHFNTTEFMKYNDFFGGTPDGINDTHILEIKCPYNSVEHLKYKTRITDNGSLYAEKKEYYYQLQCNMLVFGKKYGYFVSFDPRCDKNVGVHIVEIAYEAEVGELILKRCQEAYVIMKHYVQLLNRNGINNS